MQKHLLNIFWLLLILVSSNQIIKADSIAHTAINQYSIPDYCGNQIEKEIVIALTIGEVLASDSLYGFNFQLSYDTNKIELNNALFINTLSENCNYKFGSEAANGFFNGSAVNMGTNRIYGNKPLMAVAGKIKSSCIDSTIIKLDFIEFTKEFVKDSVELCQFVLFINKIDKEARYINSNFDRDSVKSNEDSIVTVSIDKNNNYSLNNPTCYLTGNIELVDLTTIKMLNENVSINKISNYNDTIQIELNGLNVSYGNLFQFEINNNDTIDGKIISSINSSYCDCFTRFFTDEINYKYIEKIDTTISVEDNKSYYLDYKNNFLKIEDVSNIKTVKIYNIYGAIKKLIDNKNINDIEINFDEFENGIYGVSLESDNNIEKRILVIKN